MPRKKSDGNVVVICNPEGRPGYKEMIKAKCRECHSEGGDCGVPGCPLYSVSPKNKNGDKVASADLGWLIKDEFNHGKRKSVTLKNAKHGVIRVIRRSDVYSDEE